MKCNLRHRTASERSVWIETILRSRILTRISVGRSKIPVHCTIARGMKDRGWERCRINSLGIASEVMSITTAILQGIIEVLDRILIASGCSLQKPCHLHVGLARRRHRGLLMIMVIIIRDPEPETQMLCGIFNKTEGRMRTRCATNGRAPQNLSMHLPAGDNFHQIFGTLKTNTYINQKTSQDLAYHSQ